MKVNEVIFLKENVNINDVLRDANVSMIKADDGFTLKVEFKIPTKSVPNRHSYHDPFIRFGRNQDTKTHIKDEDVLKKILGVKTLNMDGVRKTPGPRYLDSRTVYYINPKLTGGKYSKLNAPMGPKMTDNDVNAYLRRQDGKPDPKEGRRTERKPQDAMRREMDRELHGEDLELGDDHNDNLQRGIEFIEKRGYLKDFSDEAIAKAKKFNLNRFMEFESTRKGSDNNNPDYQFSKYLDYKINQSGDDEEAYQVLRAYHKYFSNYWYDPDDWYD